MRQASIQAIAQGYKREVQEEETDLGLAELQKKNEKPSWARYLRIGAVSGLGAKETMMLPVGVVFDLPEVYAQAHRTARSNEEI